MNAMAQGDGEEASRCMRAHMLNAASAIGRYISMQSKKHEENSISPEADLAI